MESTVAEVTKYETAKYCSTPGTRHVVYSQPFAINMPNKKSVTERRVTCFHISQLTPGGGVLAAAAAAEGCLGKSEAKLSAMDTPIIHMNHGKTRSVKNTIVNLICIY
jgi:hypothetical protein